MSRTYPTVFWNFGTLRRGQFPESRAGAMGEGGRTGWKNRASSIKPWPLPGSHQPFGCPNAHLETAMHDSLPKITEDSTSSEKLPSNAARHREGLHLNHGLGQLAGDPRCRLARSSRG